MGFRPGVDSTDGSRRVPATGDGCSCGNAYPRVASMKTVVADIATLAEGWRLLNLFNVFLQEHMFENYRSNYQEGENWAILAKCSCRNTVENSALF